jgi:hypothetical protein
MSTLHGIRKLASVAALATGALATSAAVAGSFPKNATHAIADLGRITVLARCDAPLADLGSLVVRASRLPPSFASLGALTVSAPRLADVQVADLGVLTVTATRIQTVALASPATRRALK